MHGAIKTLLIWSEVWPFLIPLTIFFIFRSVDKRMHILVWYVAISFVLLFAANIIARYNTSLPEFLGNNNILYNITSIIRVVFAGGYLIYHKHLEKFKFLRYAFFLYLIFAAIVMTLDNPFGHISIILTSGTSIVLLTICLTYFINAILEDEEQITPNEPAFILCMGLSIYEAINFFIYLFLYKLINTNVKFGLFTIKLFMYSVILYNVFIAIAFVHGRRRKSRPLESIAYYGK